MLNFWRDGRSGVEGGHAWRACIEETPIVGSHPTLSAILNNYYNE